MIDLRCPITCLEPLLPHSGAMILLDRITAFGADFLTAETQIRADNSLIKHNKLETFAALEIMAQGIAAWAGCMAIQAGEPVRLGYLLGSRKLHVRHQTIPIGSRLQINIRLSIQDDAGFGVFDCQLIDLMKHAILLEGALNVFSPKEDKRENKS